MLIIYYSLQTAGIETFFTRLAEERKKKQLNTTILLFDVKNSSPEILNRIKESAQIIDLQDLLNNPIRWVTNKLPRIPGSFSIFFELPVLNKKKIKNLMKDVSHIHVTSPMNLHLSFRLLQIINKQIPVSAGFYHSDTFGRLPSTDYSYFEEKNFELVYDLLPKQNLVTFNDMFPAIYKERYNINLQGVTMFPLGVIDCSLLKQKDKKFSKNLRSNPKKLKICSVGRLVDFKTYNVWMLDVVKELNEDGYEITYDIYGDGEIKNSLQKKIDQQGLTTVNLKGILSYNSFRKTVKEYDLFVGSGTAIIEAAAIGVPSIIGIERITKPLTYGYLKDIPGYTYNEEGVADLVPVKEIISKFCELDNLALLNLKNQNRDKAKEFSLEECSNNFVILEKSAGLIDPSSYNYSKAKYLLSFLINFFQKNILNRA